jgi:hypothetical protein
VDLSVALIVSDAHSSMYSLLRGDFIHVAAISGCDKIFRIFGQSPDKEAEIANPDLTPNHC